MMDDDSGASNSVNKYLFDSSQRDFDLLNYAHGVCTDEYTNPDNGDLCAQVVANKTPLDDVRARAIACIEQRQANLATVQFSLEFPEGGMPHDGHFRVDGFSGAVEIMNMASEFMDHEIVLVTARDSAGTITSPPISITTRCGPESTHIEALILDNIVGDPGAVDFSLTNQFESTNALCPIEASILSGSGGLSETVVDGDDFFEFEDSAADGFTVALNEEYQEEVGNYFYTIRTRAVGGADCDSSGYMNVTTGKVNSACYNTRLLAPSEREIERTFSQQESGPNTVFSLTGTFKTTVLGCPIQRINLSTESAQYFRLSFDGDRSFTIYKRDPDTVANDFTVYATAYGKSSSFTGKFTYDIASVTNLSAARTQQSESSTLAILVGAACVISALALAGYWFCQSSEAKAPADLPAASTATAAVEMGKVDEENVGTDRKMVATEA
jgi:hypothetical protein